MILRANGLVPASFSSGPGKEKATVPDCGAPCVPQVDLEHGSGEHRVDHVAREERRPGAQTHAHRAHRSGTPGRRQGNGPSSGSSWTVDTRRSADPSGSGVSGAVDFRSGRCARGGCLPGGRGLISALTVLGLRVAKEPGPFPPRSGQGPGRSWARAGGHGY